MSIMTKCVAKHEVYKNGDYRIISFSPLKTNQEIKLNKKYLNFTCVGENFPYIIIGKEYELEIEEGKTDSRGTSYSIVSCPSMEKKDLEKLSDADAHEILMSCTSSSRLANNILKAYPNFIHLILTEGKEAIDLSKIDGVGEVYLNAYARELTSKFKYFHILNEFKDYKLTIKDCKKLCDKFTNLDGVKIKIKENPYYVMTEVVKRSFEKVDKIIIKLRPDLETSKERCEALAISVLRRTESKGSTRLNGSSLYKDIIRLYKVPNLIPMLPEVCLNSEYIYFDENSGDLSVMSTYQEEKYASNFIKEKLSHDDVLDIDCNKYAEVNGFKMTETQLGMLENLCKHRFSLLVGYSGCVDAETEYFNGTEWKSIAEYKKGENVLQWNKDGNANLVKPIDYIAKPCEEMYHFETKYGINQSLSSEHRVIYYTPKGVLKEKTMDEVKTIHENGKSGFTGKIITTFKYNGKGIDLTDNEIKLMCAIICDGTFNSRPKETWNIHNKCRFHIKKDRKKNELRKLFKASMTPWKEKESVAFGYTDFYINAPRREKEFSSYWYDCSQEQLQLICDNVLQWDGCINKTKKGTIKRRFSTTIKQTADFIQFAFSSCGYKASISINNRVNEKYITNKKEYTRKSIEYSVTLTKRILCGMNYSGDKDERTKIKKITPTNNMKYCFTVPSSYLILRRNNKIFITGNSGKTSSLKGLVSLLEDNHMSYVLLAPTGKASMRMAEATNRSSSTIHRKCLRDKEIYSDVIIVDEPSMVDLTTFSMLLNSIKNPNARIVLCGDNAQLMPVGIGCVFNDMINSGVIPITMLTKIFRYDSSGSLFVATNVRNGRKFFDSNNSLVKTENNVVTVGDNYKFIQTTDVFETLVSEYSKLIKSGYKTKDILCLSPYNVGEHGSYRINNELQSELNPIVPNETILFREIDKVKVVFRVGDIVINKKNNYQAMLLSSQKEIEKSNGVLTKDDIETTSIFNGQCGIVRDVDDKKCVVQLGEEMVVFDKYTLNNLLLAYCISTHSSQGSEAKVVLNVVSPLHKKFISRNLLYVADTRSKKLQIDIGDMNTYNSALLVDGNKERNTWLKELLLEE